MVSQQQTAEFSGEVVRNGVATVTWCAQPLEQSEVQSRNWLANLNPDRKKDELRRTARELSGGFRKRHDAVTAVCSTLQERLLKAARNFSPGQEMDPDDIAVPELEKGEAYFHKEREDLRDIRGVLQRTGGPQAYGAKVFAELERLDKLFKYIVASFQELRWIIMIHDGSLAQSTDKTCRDGAEFMASLYNPRRGAADVLSLD